MTIENKKIVVLTVPEILELVGSQVHESLCTMEFRLTPVGQPSAYAFTVDTPKGNDASTEPLPADANPNPDTHDHEARL